jgi:ribosomal protein S18 acetylase RimI-like enzyme
VQKVIKNSLIIDEQRGEKEKMIRPTKLEDAQAIARLVLVILKDMEVAFLEEMGEEKTLEILTQAVQLPTYRYGYPRGVVKEIEGEVAGIAFGYLAAEEAIVDQPLAELLTTLNLPNIPIFVDPETYPDEWYLDAIVVADKYRGQGVGQALLIACDQTAKKAGAKKIGLCVDFANPIAQRLYERQGYQIVGQQVLSGHDYHHMQKDI